jgi:hypothetical protein
MQDLVYDRDGLGLARFLATLAKVLSHASATSGHQGLVFFIIGLVSLDLVSRAIASLGLLKRAVSILYKSLQWR